MCEYCFPYRIDSFQSLQQEEEIDLIFLKGLSNGELIVLEEVNDTETKPSFKVFGLEFGVNTLHGYTKIICNNCKTIWLYNRANLYWRGFLYKETDSPKR